MSAKKLSPPVWDEKKNAWRKNGYCQGISKTFYSKKKGITSAEKDILAQIKVWKEKMEGLSGNEKILPISKIKAAYPDYKLDLQSRTSKSHWRPACQRFEKWVLPIIGNISLIDLNDGILQKVVNNAYVNGKLSKKTLRNLRGDLTSFAKFCRKNNATNYHPCDIDIPNGANTLRKKILQPEELKILFSVDTTMKYDNRILEPYVYAFRLQVLHNLRPGEVGGLKKSDRVGDVVHLQRSINIEKEVTNGKNENALRPFKLSNLGKECWDKAAALSDSEWLFPFWNERNYYYRLKRYCQFNGISPISPYELRHTAISVSSCLPAGLVKAAAGHSQNMDTFGIYGHEVQGDMDLTAQLLDDRFSDLLGTSQKQGKNRVNLQVLKNERPKKPHKDAIS